MTINRVRHCAYRILRWVLRWAITWIRRAQRPALLLYICTNKTAFPMNFGRAVLFRVLNVNGSGKSSNSRRANPGEWVVFTIRRNDEGCSTTQPFDFAQGRELVKRQMDFLGSRQPSTEKRDNNMHCSPYGIHSKKQFFCQFHVLT